MHLPCMTAISCQTKSFVWNLSIAAFTVVKWCIYNVNVWICINNNCQVMSMEPARAPTFSVTNLQLSVRCSQTHPRCANTHTRTQTHTQPTWRTDISHLRSVLDPRHDRRQTTTASSGEDRARARCWREMLATTPSPPTFDTARPSWHCVAGRSTAWVSPCSLTCVTCRLCHLCHLSPLAVPLGAAANGEGAEVVRTDLHCITGVLSFFFLSLSRFLLRVSYIHSGFVCVRFDCGRQVVWCTGTVRASRVSVTWSIHRC